MTEKIDLNVTHARNWRYTAVFYALLFGLIGLGVFVDSAAMQWAGFVVAFLALVGMAATAEKRNKGLTIAEARKRLDELEAGK
jgi:hypothetical protein